MAQKNDAVTVPRVYSAWNCDRAVKVGRSANHASSQTDLEQVLHFTIMSTQCLTQPQHDSHHGYE